MHEKLIESTEKGFLVIGPEGPNQLSGKKRFSVLVLDGVVDRSNKFMLTGRDYWLRISRTEDDARKELEKNWDVVFTSCYLGDWNRPFGIVPELISAGKAKRIRLVISYTPIIDVGRKLTASLDQENIPNLWYPYDYQNPSKHNALEL